MFGNQDARPIKGINLFGDKRGTGQKAGQKRDKEEEEGLMVDILDLG